MVEGLANGQEIPGSAYHRWHCVRCETPMRVTMAVLAGAVKVPDRRYCEACDPQHHAPGNASSGHYGDDADCQGSWDGVVRAYENDACVG